MVFDINGGPILKRLHEKISEIVQKIFLNF